VSLNGSHYLYGGVALAAVLTVSCLLGVRSETVETPPGEFCPARWAATHDPDGANADAARVELETTLPASVRPLLPARALRMSQGCPLSLPIRIQRGSCYLYAMQVVPRAGRPRARVRFPDAVMDEAREVTIDHGMVETIGEGADPICYDDTFEGVVEVAVGGTATMVWVQVYEIAPQDAREWSSLRRSQLAAIHVETVENAEARSAVEWLAEVGAPDGGVPDGGDGAALPATAADAGASDGGASDAGPGDGAACPPDGDVADAEAGACAPAPPTPPEPPPPPPPVPEGPLAVELRDQCEDGQDNDLDGRPDCEDPDCAGQCRSFRSQRAPWLRVLDVRLGGAYRFGGANISPIDAYATDYEHLDMDGGGAGQVAAVWRPNRFLGISLDLGAGSSRLGSVSTQTAEYSEIRVSLLEVALGLSFSVSVPVWIMEIGGSVGFGWLYLRADAEWRPLSGDDTTWRDDEENDRSSSHPYGAGWAWVDFWVTDYLAVGAIGGVLVSLDGVEGLPAQDYQVGLRTTLRLGL
jgi:hypothetical protein